MSLSSTSSEEQLKKARDLISEGDALYVNDDFVNSIKCYSNALEELGGVVVSGNFEDGSHTVVVLETKDRNDNNADNRERQLNLKIDALSHRSAAYLKLDKPFEALMDSGYGLDYANHTTAFPTTLEEVIRASTINTILYSRHCEALLKLKEYNEAVGRIEPYLENKQLDTTVGERTCSDTCQIHITKLKSILNECREHCRQEKEEDSKHTTSNKSVINDISVAEYNANNNIRVLLGSKRDIDSQQQQQEQKDSTMMSTSSSSSPTSTSTTSASSNNNNNDLSISSQTKTNKAVQAKNNASSSKPVPNVPKYQYYQSDTYVTIIICESGLSSRTLQVEFEPTHLTVILHRDVDSSSGTGGGGGTTLMCDPLFDQIDVSKCKIKFKEEKTLLKLKKVEEGMTWHELFSKAKIDEPKKIKPKKSLPSLTKQQQPPSDEHKPQKQNDRMDVSDETKETATSIPVASATAATTTTTTTRPYASNRDWNAIERELEQQETDEPEGDEALNKLFQSIYQNANEDTKRAMIKSFQTSGGTVLSTNWDEVGKTDYEKERQAPKGMEWKTWEGNKLPQKED